MSRPFIFGDSHARSLAKTDVDGSYECDGWHVTGIGGATAHNLISTGSSTGAREMIMQCLDAHSGSKDVYLMFGDVDCADHIVDGDGVSASLMRYGEFVYEVFARPDVRSVYTCCVYPRTAVFTMYERTAEQIMQIIGSWNGGIVDPVDTYACLTGSDGFLLPDLAHRVADPGERHLSKDGNAVVWATLKSHHSASVI